MIPIREAFLTVGQTGLLEINGFKFPVKVLDAKQAYGNTLFLVTPINGKGEKWVNVDRFFFMDLPND